MSDTAGLVARRGTLGRRVAERLLSRGVVIRRRRRSQCHRRTLLANPEAAQEPQRGPQVSRQRRRCDDRGRARGRLTRGSEWGTLP